MRNVDHVLHFNLGCLPSEANVSPHQRASPRLSFPPARLAGEILQAHDRVSKSLLLVHCIAMKEDHHSANGIQISLLVEQLFEGLL